MAAARRPLAVIAIVLATVAIVMVALALYVRSQRNAAPFERLDAGFALVDATMPDEGGVQFVDPWASDDAGVSIDAGTCQPCGAGCGQRCTCQDGSTSTSWGCSNGCCTAPSKTCHQVCASHGGVQ